MKKKKYFCVKEHDREFKKYCRKHKIPLPSPPPEPIDKETLIKAKIKEIPNYALPYLEPYMGIKHKFTTSEAVAIIEADFRRENEALEKMKNSSDIYENFIWDYEKGDICKRKIRMNSIDFDAIFCFLLIAVAILLPSTVIYFCFINITVAFNILLAANLIVFALFTFFCIICSL